MRLPAIRRSQHKQALQKDPRLWLFDSWIYHSRQQRTHLKNSADRAQQEVYDLGYQSARLVRQDQVGRDGWHHDWERPDSCDTWAAGWSKRTFQRRKPGSSGHLCAKQQTQPGHIDLLLANEKTRTLDRQKLRFRAGHFWKAQKSIQHKPHTLPSIVKT